MERRKSGRDAQGALAEKKTKQTEKVWPTVEFRRWPKVYREREEGTDEGKVIKGGMFEGVVVEREEG